MLVSNHRVNTHIAQLKTADVASSASHEFELEHTLESENYDIILTIRKQLNRLGDLTGQVNYLLTDLKDCLKK